MPEASASLTAPAPAAAPSPSPSPAPAVDIKASPFAGLEAKAKPEPAPVVEKAPEKVVEKAPEAKALPTKEEKTAKDPKWYREQHEKTTAEIKTRDEKIRTMESRLAEAERRGQDTTALTERLAALERERDEARAEARAAKQEVSPEFKDRWDKPFNQAADFAKNVIEGMTFTDGENTRAAKWEDFVALYQMPINKAAQLARQVFGEDSQLVVQQLTELHRLDHQRANALQEEKATWKERETTEKAEQARRSEAYKNMVESVSSHLAESNPDFKDAPGDEGKEFKGLRDEGYAIFDAKPKTIQEAALKAAHVRHMVAAHYPLVRQRDQLREENASLKATIQEMKNGKPGPTSKKGESGGLPEKSWVEELREAVPASN
jgi:hypothetical protein